MRNSPGAVRQWFAVGVIRDRQLATYLAVLRADPNWGVADLGGDAVRTLRLVQFFEGTPFDVVLERATGGWRPRVP
jgi:hypothetical protein